MNKKLNIFASSFGIRANLKTKELEIQQFWAKSKLLDLLKNNEKANFILHFGPPYANGDVHIGHALNFILKDIAIRFQQMNQQIVGGLPGWDAHGLPIALAISKKQPDIVDQPLLFRQVCAQFAKTQISQQIQQLKRLGLNISFDKYYQTLANDYVAKELEIFAQLVDQNLIFTSQKPVFWSWASTTALAETEVEYLTKKSKAVFFSCPVVSEKVLLQNTSLLLWTTTPWTIPENHLVAINKKSKYLLIEVEQMAKKLLIGEQLLTSLRKELNWVKVKIINTYWGKELINVRYQHPYLQKEGWIVHGEHVNFDEGTGLVHAAPAFGVDDYQLSKNANITFKCPIDGKGYFTGDSADQQLKGVFYQDSEAIVLKQLKKAHTLVKSTDFIHQYPHDWRTKKPVIYRTTQQWYLNLKPLKSKISKIIKGVSWVPKWAEKRMEMTLQKREDWCLSRQRAWGTPMPIFIDSNNNYLLKSDLIKQVAKVVNKNGDHVWWEWELNKLLTTKQIKTYQIVGRLKDTFDVWFDSGCSATIVEKGKAIDLIWEGNDQFRGWFNSLIIVSAGLEQTFPIKQVLTHGFVNDEKGRKMSKSVGNVVNPNTVCQNLGADVLRLWVVSGNYFEDINISDKIIKSVATTYTKIRNTLRFLINNLVDFNFASEYCQHLNNSDYWILIKLNAFLKTSKVHFIEHNYHLVYLAIVRFVTIDLSQLYFDYVKTILYTDPTKSVRRKQIQTTLLMIVQKLLCLLGPLLPHTTEEAYQVLKLPKKKTSIHLEQWPDVIDLKISDQRQLEIAIINKFIADLKSDIDKNLELAIKSGKIQRPEQAIIYFEYDQNYQLFKDQKAYNDFLEKIQLVSNSKHEEIETDWKQQWAKKLNQQSLTRILRINQIHLQKNGGNKGQTGVILVEKCQQPLCSRCLFNLTKNANSICQPCQQIVWESV